MYLHCRAVEQPCNLSVALVGDVNAEVVGYSCFDGAGDIAIGVFRTHIVVFGSAIQVVEIDAVVARGLVHVAIDKLLCVMNRSQVVEIKAWPAVIDIRSHWAECSIRGRDCRIGDHGNLRIRGRLPNAVDVIAHPAGIVFAQYQVAAGARDGIIHHQTRCVIGAELNQNISGAGIECIGIDRMSNLGVHIASLGLATGFC